MPKEPKAPWNPINFTCPACDTDPGEKCTLLSISGGKEVEWVHYSRERVASEAYRRDNGAWTE